jgi:putative ABC transport system permease protein
VQALPGVQRAALSARSPLDPGFTNSFLIVGREEESQDFPEIRTRFITPGYLATTDVPLIAGRDIAPADVAGAEPVALINQSGVARYFPNVDPLDRRVRFWGVDWRIIGIIGDERFNGLDQASAPAVYTPLAQAPQTSVTILARTAGSPDALLPGLRDALRAGDPSLALGNERTLESALADTVARPRFLAFLITLFAALAITLALIGIHGVLSYSVARRAPEVGIRMALGATRGSVMGLIVGEGVRMAIVGTIIGLAGAVAAALAMRALLFGVQPFDTLSFALFPAAVIGLAALASFLPARRAVRSHPMNSLRAD